MFIFTDIEIEYQGRAAIEPTYLRYQAQMELALPNLFVSFSKANPKPTRLVHAQDSTDAVTSAAISESPTLATSLAPPRFLVFPR